jgi:hypothetical protein
MINIINIRHCIIRILSKELKGLNTLLDFSNNKSLLPIIQLFIKETYYK